MLFFTILVTLLLFVGTVAGFSLFAGWLMGLPPHPPEPYRIPIAILCLLAGIICMAGFLTITLHP